MTKHRPLALVRERLTDLGPDALCRVVGADHTIVYVVLDRVEQVREYTDHWLTYDCP